ncbi:MAG: ribonuclease E activity regulator RraA [Lysobacteraceae bacterium]
MSHAVADLSDAHPEAAVCEPLFRDYGGRRRFHGPIRTLKVFEDNAQVRAMLETAGDGAVLVIDGGGSLRCALVGGNLGQLAVRNDWAGIIVHGCVRDSAELAQQAVGVKALASHPRKSAKGLHGAQADQPVSFAGVRFTPGQWLYADEDGILVSEQPLD